MSKPHFSNSEIRRPANTDKLDKEDPLYLAFGDGKYKAAMWLNTGGVTLAEAASAGYSTIDEAVVAILKSNEKSLGIVIQSKPKEGYGGDVFRFNLFPNLDSIEPSGASGEVGIMSAAEKEIPFDDEIPFPDTKAEDIMTGFNK